MDSIEELNRQKTEITNQIRAATPEERVVLIRQAHALTVKLKELAPRDVNKPQKKKATTVPYECAECKQNFESSSAAVSSRGPIIVFCKDCRKIRGDDLIELITEEGFRIFSKSQLKEAEEILKTLGADYRLDLHKTLDTIHESTVLGVEACCISYVGCLTETRIDAREEITLRISTKQIKFGALVFSRGSYKDPDARNNHSVAGSKAWFNRSLATNSDAVFIDDSEDHVKSVQAVGITSLQIQHNQKLLSLLK